MSQVITDYEVLTLEEAAGFLRITPQRAEELATGGTIPGRRLDHDWRFLKSALENWLRGRDDKRTLLDQAGALKDDNSLAAMRDMIYAERGRPEVGNSAEG
jgi:hypothetical protein